MMIAGKDMRLTFTGQAIRYGLNRPDNIRALDRQLTLHVQRLAQLAPGLSIISEGSVLCLTSLDIYRTRNEAIPIALVTDYEHPNAISICLEAELS